jgi:glycosyltransferase involved in cell wall biosynthesis
VWTHAPLLRAQIRSAAAVVAVSQPVADQLARSYDRPVVVAPNAPSEVFSRWTEDDDVALRDLGLTAGSYFLAVGNRDPRKNLPRLAAAYAQLSARERRQHPLVLVGGGDAIYRSESIAWPAGTVDAGFVSDDHLRQLYRGARSVVFVTLAEGFGLPLVEAAAAGARSFLISDIEVFRWIFGEHARYVSPTSPESIAAGLRADIARPIPQEIDLDRFSWDSSAAVIRDVCRRVATGR